MKKRRVLFSLFLLAVFVSGCGKKSEMAADRGPVVLTVFDMVATIGQDANSIAYTSQYEKFLNDFPDVRVSRESVAHDEYETKLKTYIAADELPDAFMTKGTVLPELVRDGEITEVMQIIRSVPGWEQEYKPGVYEDFIINGQTYAIPYQLGNNHCLFWNSNIFTECGISEFPDTWQGFLDAVQILKSKGYVPIVMGNKEQWPLPSLFFNTVVYRYAPVEWYYSLRDNKGAKFTDPEFIRAATAMQELVQMGTFNSDLNSIDNNQKNSVYFNKQAAMMVDGYWMVATFDMTCPGDVLAATRIAQLPAIPKELNGTGIGNINQAASGWGFGVKNRLDTDKIKALSNYLHYVCGSDYATIIVANSGGAAANPRMVDESKLSPLYLELLRQNSKCIFAPVFDVQLNAQIVDAFYSNLQDLAIGRMTPQRYAELLQVELDATR
jgi:raffinose/stachyose/melibiose transport system substrate-binding protein